MSKEEQHYFEFNREIDMYSRMDHNNVIRVLGVCREAEPLILITEHCDWVRISWAFVDLMGLRCFDLG